MSAPFSWPEITRTSGFKALTLVSVTDMSLSSGGSWSSITTIMPCRRTSSSTPARTSCANGSFSMASATFSLSLVLPSSPACSAARSMAGVRYWSEVDSTAKM